MPAADSQTGLHRLEPGGDENLANALSAFLSQLHTSRDDAHMAEPGDPASTAVPGHNGLEMAPVSGLGPAGGSGTLLPRRLATSIGATSTPANRVLGSHLPKATELAARPPAVARDPQVDASAPEPFMPGTKTPANATGTDHGLRKRRFGRAAKAPAGGPGSGGTTSARTAVATGGSAANGTGSGPTTRSTPAATGGSAANGTGSGPTTRSVAGGTSSALRAPGAAPALPAGPGAATVVSTRGWGGRVTIVAAITVAVLLAAGLGVSLVWGHNKSAAFTAEAHQLTLMQGDIGASQSGLDADEARIASQLDNIRSLDTMYSAVRAQLKTTKAELGTVQSQLERARGQFSQTEARLNQAQSRLSQAQDRLSQAQDQVAQSQSQLGSLEAQLSGSQAHAAECQLGVSLGQQMFQLQGAFILLQNGYFTAVQAKDTAKMQQDLAQMDVLDKQVQGVGAQFTAAVGTCTHGG